MFQNICCSDLLFSSVSFHDLMIWLCYTSYSQVSPVWQDGDVKYSLYGVLVHSGFSTHSGHYYCYVRTSNNMWYTLDDTRVLIIFDLYSIV